MLNTMTEILTPERLAEFPNQEVFTMGFCDNFVSNDPRGLVWVATKGGIEDWAIYIQLESLQTPERNDRDFVARHGDKIASEIYIQRLVPNVCMGLYRR